GLPRLRTAASFLARLVATALAVAVLRRWWCKGLAAGGWEPGPRRHQRWRAAGQLHWRSASWEDADRSASAKACSWRLISCGFRFLSQAQDASVLRRPLQQGLKSNICTSQIALCFGAPGPGSHRMAGRLHYGADQFREQTAMPKQAITGPTDATSAVRPAHRRALLIVNPNSRRGGEADLQSIVERLEAASVSVLLKESKSPEHCLEQLE